MAETIMTVPMKERGKAPANRKFEKAIAELISLMSETSCPGKEVFVKELVSLSTTRLEVKESERMDDDRAQNGGKELYISLMFDGERNYLTFEDNGVGMTELNLKTLGIMPKLGTKALISAIKAGKDLSSTKLFDVGFFTVFAVADKITIKSTPSEWTGWYMWESVATERRFTVQRIQNPDLKCQTQVTLHLKKDVADNIRSSGLDRFLREHNCHSSYKIRVQSYTVINSSKEGSLGPQGEAAKAVVTRDPQEHVGNTPATLQESCNPNTSPKDKSPVPVPKSYTVINSSKEGSLGPQEEAAKAVVTRDPQEHVGNTPATLQESCNPNTSPKDKSSVPVPKASSPTTNVPVSAEPARTESPDYQGKGIKRKSIKQSPFQETPKSRKMSFHLDVPVTPGVTNGKQNHIGKCTETPLRDVTNPKSSTPKTPGSASAHSNFNISSLAFVKHFVGKNATIAVKVMRWIEPGKERPKSDGETWRRGSYEVVDSTDRAILKVYGPHDMKFFQPRQNVLLHNVWIKEDHIAFTIRAKVEEYKGEIKMVEDINKKRRSDEAKNRMTLEDIKKSPGCKAAARLHISQVGDAHQYNKKDGAKSSLKKLVVKNQKNSSKTYELVTFHEIAAMCFEVQRRYQFHCITYNPERKNFQTIGQTLPQLV